MSSHTADTQRRHRSETKWRTGEQHPQLVLATNQVNIFCRYQLTKLVPDSEDNREDVDSLLGTENSAENVENVQQLSKTKRKASTHEAKAPKKQKVNKKFTWSPRMIEDLLAYMKECKSSCDFKGLDFEADLSSMYTQIRNSMARHYVDDFGPEKVTESEVELKDMDKDT